MERFLSRKKKNTSKATASSSSSTSLSKGPEHDLFDDENIEDIYNEIQQEVPDRFLGNGKKFKFLVYSVITNENNGKEPIDFLDDGKPVKEHCSSLTTSNQCVYFKPIGVYTTKNQAEYHAKMLRSELAPRMDFFVEKMNNWFRLPHLVDLEQLAHFNYENNELNTMMTDYAKKQVETNSLPNRNYIKKVDEHVLFKQAQGIVLEKEIERVKKGLPPMTKEQLDHAYIEEYKRLHLEKENKCAGFDNDVFDFIENKPMDSKSVSSSMTNADINKKKQKTKKKKSSSKRAKKLSSKNKKTKKTEDREYDADNEQYYDDDENEDEEEEEEKQGDNKKDPAESGNYINLIKNEDMLPDEFMRKFNMMPSQVLEEMDRDIAANYIQPKD